jgi:hypothetical protein
MRQWKQSSVKTKAKSTAVEHGVYPQFAALNQSHDGIYIRPTEWHCGSRLGFGLETLAYRRTKRLQANEQVAASSKLGSLSGSAGCRRNARTQGANVC